MSVTGKEIIEASRNCVKGEECKEFTDAFLISCVVNDINLLLQLVFSTENILDKNFSDEEVQLLLNEVSNLDLLYHSMPSLRHYIVRNSIDELKVFDDFMNSSREIIDNKSIIPIIENKWIHKVKKHGVLRTIFTKFLKTRKDLEEVVYDYLKAKKVDSRSNQLPEIFDIYIDRFQSFLMSKVEDYAYFSSSENHIKI